MKRKLVVGLTGGIACGKTTVANIFRSFGAYVIDADLVGHQLLREDPRIKKQLVSAFGECILNDKGEIDRSKLSRIVFDNPDYLCLLNSLVHPSIIELINSKINQVLSSVENKIVVLDAALLIELNMMYMVDSVVLVYAEEDVQLRRLAERGLSQEDAEKRIRSQKPLREKIRFADFVIHNSGLLSDTTRQAKQVWKSLNAMLCAEEA